MAEIFDRPTGNQPDPTRAASPTSSALRWLPAVAILIVLFAVVMMMVNARKGSGEASPAGSSATTQSRPDLSPAAPTSRS